MRTLVYVVWLLIPTVMLVLVAWDFVDNVAKRKTDKHVLQHLKQVLFVCVAIGLSASVDIYLLDWLVTLPVLDWVGRDLCLVLLLPSALFLGAVIIGPSKPILISDLPRLGKRDR